MNRINIIGTVMVISMTAGLSAQEVDLASLGLPMGNVACMKPTKERLGLECRIVLDAPVINIRQNIPLCILQNTNPNIEIVSDDQTLISVIVAVPQSATYESDAIGGIEQGHCEDREIAVLEPGFSPACEKNPEGCFAFHVFDEPLQVGETHFAGRVDYFFSHSGYNDVGLGTILMPGRYIFKHDPND